MNAPVLKHQTIEQYLESERISTFKSEYYRGEVFAMSGASFVHNKLASNLLINIGYFLRGKSCSIYGSDLRIHIPKNSLIAYPDASIICGKPPFLDDEQDTILNPAVIFEILSPSTKNYDRGEKFRLYRDIPSFSEYIIILSDTIGVEYYSKQSSGSWVLSEFKSPEDAVPIEAIGFKLLLQDMYEGLEF